MATSPDYPPAEDGLPATEVPPADEGAAPEEPPPPPFYRRPEVRGVALGVLLLLALFALSVLASSPFWRF